MQNEESWDAEWISSWCRIKSYADQIELMQNESHSGWRIPPLNYNEVALNRVLEYVRNDNENSDQILSQLEIPPKLQSKFTSNHLGIRI